MLSTCDLTFKRRITFLRMQTVSKLNVAASARSRAVRKQMACAINERCRWMVTPASLAASLHHRLVATHTLTRESLSLPNLEAQGKKMKIGDLSSSHTVRKNPMQNTQKRRTIAFNPSSRVPVLGLLVLLYHWSSQPVALCSM